MADSAPRLNRLAITTPSDSLSLKTIEQTDVTSHPDYDGVMKRLPQDERIPNAFYLAMKTKEEWLMEKAFAQAIGAEEPYPQATRQEIIDALVEDYRVFQIAEGVHTAEELIRELESAATLQGVQQQGGHGRG